MAARYRAEHVGSLLRPAYLRQARERFDERKITAEELRKVEDQAIQDAVRMQEEVGLDVVTDGEYRRLLFTDSFGASVSGLGSGRPTLKALEASVQGTPVGLQRRPVLERLRLIRNVPLEEYLALVRFAQRPAKVTLLGPDRIIQRFDQKGSASVYPTIDEFVSDVVKIAREIVRSLVEAGCRYVQIDAPGYTVFVDAPSLFGMRQRGESPTENFTRSLRADNQVVDGFQDVTFGLHLCRGNRQWHREGSYDAIAERLFNELDHDRFLLEYDTARVGGFEPLRFVPKGKIIVLGLVSTKVAELETVDSLRRRIDEAGKYVPLEQLAISPQCGFASSVADNLISEDDQKRKLEVVVETARQVWG